MMVYAILPHKWANMLIRVMRFTDKTFGGFIYGKLLDSAIIGILCYFGMLLLDLPYPILISVIIGVTNVIRFWSLHRSHSMYFAYFSSRSHKKVCILQFLSCFFSSLMEISLVRKFSETLPDFPVLWLLLPS